MTACPPSIPLGVGEFLCQVYALSVMKKKKPPPISFCFVPLPELLGMAPL